MAVEFQTKKKTLRAEVCLQINYATDNLAVTDVVGRLFHKGILRGKN